MKKLVHNRFFIIVIALFLSFITLISSAVTKVSAEEDYAFSDKSDVIADLNHLGVDYTYYGMFGQSSLLYLHENYFDYENSSYYAIYVYFYNHDNETFSKRFENYNKLTLAYGYESNMYKFWLKLCDVSEDNLVLKYKVLGVDSIYKYFSENEPDLRNYYVSEIELMSEERFSSGESTAKSYSCKNSQVVDYTRNGIYESARRFLYSGSMFDKTLDCKCDFYGALQVDLNSTAYNYAPRQNVYQIVYSLYFGISPEVYDYINEDYISFKENEINAPYEIASALVSFYKMKMKPAFITSNDTVYQTLYNYLVANNGEVDLSTSNHYDNNLDFEFYSSIIERINGSMSYVEYNNAFNIERENLFQIFPNFFDTYAYVINADESILGAYGTDFILSGDYLKNFVSQAIEDGIFLNKYDSNLYEQVNSVSGDIPYGYNRIELFSDEYWKLQDSWNSMSGFAKFFTHLFTGDWNVYEDLAARQVETISAETLKSRLNEFRSGLNNETIKNRICQEFFISPLDYNDFVTEAECQAELGNDMVFLRFDMVDDNACYINANTDYPCYMFSGTCYLDVDVLNFGFSNGQTVKYVAVKSNPVDVYPNPQYSSSCTDYRSILSVILTLGVCVLIYSVVTKGIKFIRK